VYHCVRFTIRKIDGREFVATVTGFARRIKLFDDKHVYSDDRCEPAPLPTFVLLIPSFPVVKIRRTFPIPYAHAMYTCCSELTNRTEDKGPKDDRPFDSKAT
jgi:hypothetical protein